MSSILVFHIAYKFKYSQLCQYNNHYMYNLQLAVKIMIV